MAGEIRNIPASVHQRLLAKARESSRPFNELLQHFAIERFLYRLSKSPQAGRFVLKGALMLSAWSRSMTRPTMDIDLSGKIENDPDALAAAMKDTCMMTVTPDGMSFNAETVTTDRIMEDAGYKGVRVLVHGNLGNARISLQVDIGFGDVIVPGSSRITYPVLLDFPSPELNGYSMESTIAEKFHAMRNTPVPAAPAVFDPSFVQDRGKNVQWQGFIRKSRISGTPDSFADIVAGVNIFLEPIKTALFEQRMFRSFWKAPGPWGPVP